MSFVSWLSKISFFQTFFLLVFPCKPKFCKSLSTFQGIIFFLLITTLFANHFKMMQYAVVS